jgi:hypothetical protein
VDTVTQSSKCRCSARVAFKFSTRTACNGRDFRSDTTLGGGNGSLRLCALEWMLMLRKPPEPVHDRFRTVL